MRLARLELYGFKSFPDRTTFHFGPGVSCVVGPNGSGKSNVVDALKWCVGEQSARSLRGAEMTDVIFAGSTDRKPVGFAEVVLTLITDETRPFPGDFAPLREVQVGRRLHRSGASEYTINQNKVRRRDVIELLLDSGIGNDLYSFIEQGQVDKMISASPAERRTLIDEAAGISRYKARREEARERLEATAAQLDRAADVVDEMARHLRTLEGQVLKAAEFRRLGTRIRLGELRLALAKHVALAADRSIVRTEVEQKRAAEGRAKLDVERREQDLEQRRVEIELVEVGLATIRERVAELDGRIREANAAAQVHERRAEELGNERTRATGEAERQRSRAAKAADEGRAAAVEGDGLERELAENELGLERATEEAAAAEQALGRAREELAATEAAGQQALRAKIAAESVLAEAKRQASDRELRIAALEAERAGRVSDQVLATQRRAKLVDERAAAEEAVVGASARVTSTEAELERVRALEAEAREALARAEEGRDRALAAREKARKERAAALERGRKWVDAAAQVASRERAAAEKGWTAKIQAAEKAVRDEAAAARKAAGSEAEAAVAAAEAAGKAERERVEAELKAAGEALARARKARDAADARLVEVAKAHAAVEAELGVVRRQLTATDGADALVRTWTTRAVLDEVPADARSEWTKKLGDRAKWPLVRDPAALVAIAKARPEKTTVQLVFWPEGGRTPAESIGSAIDLAEALTAPWPVVGEGFRIEPGGFVTLGPPSALERAVASEKVLVEKLAAVEADRAAAEAGKAAAASQVESAARAQEAASSARESAVKAAADALAKVRAEGAERVAAAERTAREAAEQALVALRGDRDRDLEERGAAAGRQAEALRAELDAFAAVPEESSTGPDEVAPARDQVRAASERTEAARKARESALEGRRSAERVRDSAADRVEAVDRELAEIERRMAAATSEIGRLAAERANQADPASLEAGLAAAVRAEDDARKSVAAAREAVGRAEAAERTAREAVTRLKVERASRVERVAACRERVAAASSRSAEAVAAAERAEAHAAELAAHAQEAVEARRTSLEDAAAATVERGAAWDLQEVERQRLQRLVEARETAERGLRQVRSQLERLSQDIERMSAQLGSVSQDLEVLKGRMEDRYQVSLPRLLELLRVEGRVVLEVDPDVAAGTELAGVRVEGVPPLPLTAEDLQDERQIKAAVADLEDDKLALAALGEVNLAAPQEYKDLRLRHDELAAQRGDLEQSVEGIRAAIAKLNRMCRERFRETFDQVNDHFREVYPKLVGGGSARLALTDEEDLLETGVEIFVQPPGKRLQNLQLLSGGEKAMTAIALLIALFRVKPSPFCVLDEVDAPLDEANGTRFNEMLKEMSVHSQFLVITHNRKTMECADTLYGITMARPGVSRLVSVDLDAW
jgi:chromosome segregation protein